MIEESRALINLSNSVDQFVVICIVVAIGWVVYSYIKGR